MFETHFNHTIIRNYTIVVASLFADLQVERGGELIKIPMTVLNSDRGREREDENPIDGKHVKQTLPRTSLEFMGLSLDPSRKTNPLTKLKTAPDAQGSIGYQMMRSPYVFSYRVAVRTKTIDQMLQVMEQVCANIDPFVDFNVNDNADLGFETAVRVKLTGNDFEDNFADPLDEDRFLDCVFDIELEGWLYKRTSSTGIIKVININFSDIDNLEDLGAIQITEDETQITDSVDDIVPPP